MHLKKLSELRIKHRLTQEELSKILGVGRSTYSMYEQGNREMDYTLLVKLADFYKVSLDYLFNRTEFPIIPDLYSKDEIEFMTKSLKLYKELRDKYK